MENPYAAPLYNTLLKALLEGAQNQHITMQLPIKRLAKTGWTRRDAGQIDLELNHGWQGNIEVVERDFVSRNNQGVRRITAEDKVEAYFRNPDAVQAQMKHAFTTLLIEYMGKGYRITNLEIRAPMHNSPTKRLVTHLSTDRDSVLIVINLIFHRWVGWITK